MIGIKRKQCPLKGVTDCFSLRTTEAQKADFTNMDFILVKLEVKK